MKRWMLSLAVALVAVGGASTLLADDWDHYHGYPRSRSQSHSRYHDDLEHRDYHRDLEHRQAHRYPMTWRDHEALHDDLDHDAYHDNLEHRQYHRRRVYSHYSIPRYGYGYGGSGYGYYRPGFSIWIGR